MISQDTKILYDPKILQKKPVINFKHEDSIVSEINENFEEIYTKKKEEIYSDDDFEI